jgi:pilus assembly protein TadC
MPKHTIELTKEEALELLKQYYNAQSSIYVNSSCDLNITITDLEQPAQESQYKDYDYKFRSTQKLELIKFSRELAERIFDADNPLEMRTDAESCRYIGITLASAKSFVEEYFRKYQVK